MTKPSGTRTFTQWSRTIAAKFTMMPGTRDAHNDHIVHQISLRGVHIIYEKVQLQNYLHREVWIRINVTDVYLLMLKH